MYLWNKRWQRIYKRVLEREIIIWSKKWKGKVYFDGKLFFEGEYLNGQINGKGKAYDSSGELYFEGEYLKGQEWNGKGKKYIFYSKSDYEGEFLCGKLHGKGKEYNHGGNLIFEGEYFDGKRWEGKKYDINGNVIKEINWSLKIINYLID